MTEFEWTSCQDPTAMLAFLRDSGRASERKARLFAVACCRRIWPLLTDERSRRAVEVAERFADGHADLAELEEQERQAGWAAAWAGQGDAAEAAAWAASNRQGVPWATTSAGAAPAPGE